MTEYYNNLKGFWLELALYDDIVIKSAADTRKLKDWPKREWIFEFLMLFNQDYDLACGQILGKEPLPSLSDVFAFDCGEEIQKSVMLGKTSSLLKIRQLHLQNPLAMLGTII